MFTLYLYVVIILFKTGLYKSVIFTYSSRKLDFPPSVFPMVLSLFRIFNFDVTLIRLHDIYHL